MACVAEGRPVMTLLHSRTLLRLLATVLALHVSAAPAVAQDAAAKALDAASLLRELESAVRLARALKIEARPAALREGEDVVLTIDLPAAGYLNVVSLDPAGEATVLFPNRLHADNRVEPGRFTFPTATMAFQIRAAAPFGESRIAALLSAEPLNLYSSAASEPGGALAQFARLSATGRDLINLFGTRALQPAGTTTLAGDITSVLTCPPTGPCQMDAAPAGGAIRRILDAVVPGILLDKGLPPPPGAAPPRPVPEAGLRLVKASEGFVPRLYLDVAGHCTIAYGHLMRLGPCGTPDRQRYPGRIGEPTGERLLFGDLAHAQRAVMALVSAPLTDGQYASLVDFTFNVGAGNLKRSTLLKAVNAGQHERVPFQLMRWTRAGGQELRGLRVRREREVALYFEGRPVPKQLPAGEDTTPLDIRSGEPGS